MQVQLEVKDANLSNNLLVTIAEKAGNRRNLRPQTAHTPTKNQAFDMILQLIVDVWFCQWEGAKAFAHCGIGRLKRSKLIPGRRPGCKGACVGNGGAILKAHLQLMEGYST